MRKLKSFSLALTRLLQTSSHRVTDSSPTIELAEDQNTVNIKNLLTKIENNAANIKMLRN